MSNVFELLNDAATPGTGKDYQDVLGRVIPYWDAVAAAFPAGFVMSYLTWTPSWRESPCGKTLPGGSAWGRG